MSFPAYFFEHLLSLDFQFVHLSHCSLFISLITHMHDGWPLLSLVSLSTCITSNALYYSFATELTCLQNLKFHQTEATGKAVHLEIRCVGAQIQSCLYVSKHCATKLCLQPAVWVLQKTVKIRSWLRSSSLQTDANLATWQTNFGIHSLCWT